MSEQQADNNYMAMLNNPYINPEPSPGKNALEKQNTKLKPCHFPETHKAQNILAAATKETYLVSESDEPLEWINTKIEQDSLPSSESELIELGLIEKEDVGKLKIQPLTDSLLFNKEEYKHIVAACKKAVDSSEWKVYRVENKQGTTTVVFVLSIAQGSNGQKALVGLKSLLVQT
ncbi:hypothetical protein EDC96DRAFT_573606 [Choanephora cucurbitarum]|nr:hypothetical protein EDC96DRAFT_573606 [Choanephora cucurbitarum]